jgi:AraC-like DNA-binding protein
MQVQQLLSGLSFPDRSILTTTIGVREPKYGGVFQGVIERRGCLARAQGAALANVSPSWFSHEFTRLFGMSFRVAQVRIKIQLAALFLVSTRCRVSEIAYYLGYTDLKKFGRAFKSHFGTSARTYRDMVRDSEVPLRSLQHLFGDSAEARVNRVQPKTASAPVCSACCRPLPPFNGQQRNE